MAGLMAEMAEQGAIGFVHRAARLFARRIVGLRGADGDQAFLVAGHSRHDIAVALDRILEEIEDQAALRVLRPIGMR